MGLWAGREVQEKVMRLARVQVEVGGTVLDQLQVRERGKVVLPGRQERWKELAEDCCW